MKKVFALVITIVYATAVYSQSCLPSGIDFITQTQVDNFQSNYPGCTEIEGGVEIHGNDITNLDGLSVLTAIGGFLYISNNASLTDLTGLSSLSSVGGSLLISTNASLTSLDGFVALTQIAGDVYISNNPLLNDISALANVSTTEVEELRITGNISLATCDNQFICNYLSNPNGKVNIYNNAEGCNNPPEIADACGITLPCLPYGNYYFNSQVEIDNFQANYPGCTNLQGLVHIQGTEISSLAGLNVVTSINGPLELYQNPMLVSLEGLDSLDYVDGAVSINGNAILTDINALSNLDTSLMSYLVISNNPLLSDCAIASFCDYLFGPFGSSHQSISNNAGGCNSIDEVQFQCTVGFDDNILDDESFFTISPNPASNEITAKVSETSSQFQISIFNTSGQEIISKEAFSTVINIDVSGMQAGVYIVRMKGENTIGVKRFVKIK